MYDFSSSKGDPECMIFHPLSSFSFFLNLCLIIVVMIFMKFWKCLVVNLEFVER
jgi:hypothetical protein